MSETTAGYGVLRLPEDYAGYRVLDALGQKIGTVDELFLNAHDEPEYLMVRMGLFGLKLALLPVETVAIDEQRRALMLH